MTGLIRDYEENLTNNVFWAQIVRSQHCHKSHLHQSLCRLHSLSDLTVHNTEVCKVPLQQVPVIPDQALTEKEKKKSENQAAPL